MITFWWLRKINEITYNIELLRNMEVYLYKGVDYDWKDNEWGGESLMCKS